ncbi:MAG: metallophosphoesterase [Chitinophagaceae bacterium]|nr:metallophosphoesterase [Chitinophagaceae bacterium]
MRLKLILITIFTVNAIGSVNAQDRIPSSYSNLAWDAKGLYYLEDSVRYYSDTTSARYTLKQMLGNPKGTSTGVEMNFKNIEGTITYGLIPYGQAPHPLPVYRVTRRLANGMANINIITDFRDPFDMVGWQQSGQLSIGYRLTNQAGLILFDGVISVTGKGPFEIVPAIYEGPYVNNITSGEAVIWFETSMPVKASIQVDHKLMQDSVSLTHHEFKITGLQPEKKYDYTVNYGPLKQTYSFTTAPLPGSRKSFVFAYTSDSRHALGGGERMVYGTNAYIMKKIGAVAVQQKAAFMQFTGDMINGYLTNKEEQLLQYTNWKNSLAPFWHYMPVYVGQGNHEALGHIFKDSSGATVAFIDRFPYDTESAEALMQEAFVNPLNGPDSEDGNKYDIDKKNKDFPSYKETVFYYTYDNVAMIVLNADYWYAPSISRNAGTSGNLHGYLMDNQIRWLEQTIKKLEGDNAIDHIFLTQHTPIFPNGGHVGDDMWYNGNNDKRPYISGKPVDKGIIERRDEYLDILINKSKKVVAVLTGDEHNYNRLELTSEVKIYPENWKGKKIKISRPIFQINNGAAGAPYYAQEQAPWSPHTKAFSVQNAICLFYVNGKEIIMKVVNPDTLNDIDEIKLR